MGSSSPSECVIAGCSKPPKARGLCGNHYATAHRHGVLDQYRYQSNRGEPFINHHGYRVVHRPGHPLANKQGHVLEHRLVAWETFGPFDPSRHVHHIDENKLNNDPSNLEVLTPSAHMTEHTSERIRARTGTSPSLRAVEARRLYDLGLTTTEVAKLLDTHPGNVSRLIRRAGGTARGRHGRRDDVPVDGVVRLWTVGASIAEIATLYGCSKDVIRRIAADSDLPRSRGGRRPRSADAAVLAALDAER